MSVQEIQDDIKELQTFLDQATRTKVKDGLNLQIRKFQTELIKLQEAEKKKAGAEQAKNDSQEKPVMPSPVQSSTSGKGYTKDLKNYAWDQSDKFMKLYVDIPGVHTVPSENVSASYTNTSVKVTATVGNCTFSLHVAPLYKNIVTSASKMKVKTDKVLVMLKKAKESETWAYVTDKDKKKTVPKMDEKADPQDGLMSMLKGMYDDGDDDMKRTLTKAWSESQEKKNKGMEPSPMDDL